MARKRKHRRKNPGMVVVPNSPRRRGGRRHRNDPARRHRRRRHNPARGIVGQVTQGAMDALGVVTGKVFSRAVPALVGLNLTGFAGVAIQAASAVVGGFVGSKIKPGFGRMVLAGGLAGIIEGYAKALNIPVISPALGDEYDAAMQHGMAAYTLPGAEEPLGLYPGFSGDEAYDRDIASSQDIVQ